MNCNHTLKIVASVLAITGTAVLAESQTSQDPMAEARAFLSSPTSLSQAITAAEAAAGGKVYAIEYQSGQNGAPDLIMATVTLAEDTEKTVAMNPADGKMMIVTLTANDMNDGSNESDGGSENGSDGENGNN